MVAPGLNFASLIDALTSHASQLGVFDTINGHEPVSAPGDGLTCAVWLQRIAPPRGGSGLSATSALLTFNVRIYKPLPTQPQDYLDQAMVDAISTLLAAYSGDFDLGATVRLVDLLGWYGTPVSAQAGYMTWGGTQYRVVTITLPVVVDDVWEQTA